MSDTRRSRWLWMLVAIAACTQQHTETSVVRPGSLPELPAAELAPPVVVPIAGSATFGGANASPEPRVNIDTHGRDEDVRALLDFVARVGGYRLVYPVNFNRRVRVSLNDVPVSVALSTLLGAADLTLEATTPGAQRPSMRPVVFYELPMNVDSLSADAIIKRFGVSPAVANMIVTSRGKP